MQNKNYIKFTIVALISTFILNQSKGQVANFITNGSFETPINGLAQPYPDDLAQCEKLYFWETRTKVNGAITYASHSPEWCYKNFLEHSEGPAHTGSGYVAMGDYELIQQQVSGLVNNQMYIVNLYIKSVDFFWPNSNITVSNPLSKFNVFMSKQKIKYKDEPTNENQNCLVDFVEHENGPFQDILEIGSYPINRTEYPSGSGWHEISFAFIYKANYDWLTFEVRQETYTNQGPGFYCQQSYTLLDDISITNFCDNFCVSPNRTNPVFGYYTNGNFNSGFIPSPVGVGVPQNSNTYHPFSMYVTNANYIRFTIFDGWGGIHYEIEDFDPIALHDPNYSDKYVFWDGKDKYNYCSPIDVYAYQMVISNCSGNIYVHNGTIAYLGVSSTGCHQDQTIFNTNIPNCCPDNKIYNNVNLSGNIRDDVNDFIEVGKTGPVTFSNNTNVVWHAGNDIRIGGFFQSNINSNYEMKIVPCGTPRLMKDSTLIDNRNIYGKKSDKYLIDNTTFLVATETIIKTLEVKYLCNKPIRKVNLYSIDGKIIPISWGSNAIQFGNFVTGVFILEFVSSDDEVFRKKIILIF